MPSSSSISCPYCLHAMELKGAKPGRFTPKCPQCKRAFLLAIPDDPARAPVITAFESQLRAKEPVETRAAAPAETAPPQKQTKPRSNGDDELPAAIAAALALDDQTIAAPPTGPRPQLTKPAAPRMPPVGAVFVNAPEDSPGLGDLDATIEAHLARASANGDGNGDHASSAPTLAAPADDPDATAEAPPPREHGVDDFQPPAPKRGVNVAESMQRMLGGYQIMQKLGEGGMGSVFLARQLSLDRPVAVKVLKPQLAKDPHFLARFTREAYAAAQLVHHNVVQIHDIGAEDETHYFSMEFVRGQSLNDLLKRDGKLDPEVAVGFVLQAARGLKFAHDHGMIHRDVKPDNLLINEEGIIKVADLGLVKTAGFDQTQPAPAPAAAPTQAAASRAQQAAASSATDTHTQVKVAMGTPSYMPPEQAADAANVDARADIYSLGCTLYALLVGYPPFQAASVAEMIRKHKQQAPPTPDVLNPRVPPQLSAIVLKMLAKTPDERYRNLAEVIHALEEFLGISTAAAFSPREESVQELETNAAAFNSVGLAKAKPLLISLFFLLCAIGAGAFAFVPGYGLQAVATLAFAAFTSAWYFVISGIGDKAYLFRRVRSAAWNSTWRDWIDWVIAAGLLVATLVVFNSLLPWLIAFGGAFIAAFLFYFCIDRTIADKRKKPLENAHQLLTHMRLRGLEENAIRHFAYKYAGPAGEEFYEALFGYEALLAARKHWSKGTMEEKRRKFRPWRDPVIRRLDKRLRIIQELKDRRILQAVQEKALKADGLLDIKARQQARRMAEVMIMQAAELRDEASEKAAAFGKAALGTDQEQAAIPRQKQAFLFTKEEEDAASDRARRRPHVRHSYLERRFGGPHDILFGDSMRLVLGALMLIGFLTWCYQNKMLVGQEFAEHLKHKVDQKWDTIAKPWTIDGQGGPTSESQGPDRKDPRTQYYDLKIKGVPPDVAHALSSYNAAVAAVILLLSAWYRGGKIGLLIIPIAALALLGHHFIPPFGPYPPETVAMVIGGALALLTFVFVAESG